MTFDEQRFKAVYSSIKDDLDYFSRQMINTMYFFIKQNHESDVFFSKKNILMEFEKLSRLMEKNCKNKNLLAQVSLLGNKIQNNDYYFDLLVKLECAMGICPDDFFLSIVQLIFYNDIYLNIINCRNKENLIYQLESILDKSLQTNEYTYQISDQVVARR